MPKPAGSCGDSMAKRTSSVRSCRASGWKLRGTAFWRDGGKLRVFLNSRHRMFSLEAGDGRPVRSFGDAGAVSLTDGLARMSDITHSTQSSPPVVYRDLVIVGSQVPDRVQLPDPMGYVQAFNARTGKRVWAFSAIPQSAKDPGAETWENESWRKNGHANVWAPMALDDGAGPALPADVDADERLLRRRAAGRQPLRRVAGLSRRGDGQDEVALSDGPSRTVGLRHAGAAESGDHHRERPADRCGRADHQAGIHLRLRSRDRPAGLADRRTPGAGRQQRARRETLSDAAVPHETARVRRSRRVARGRERLDAGDQGDGAGADAELPHRPALHAAVARRHAAASGASRRRQLGRRGVRP